MVVTATGLRVSLREPGTEGSLGDRAAFAHIFFAGVYDFLLTRMSPGDIVLDAGANIGCFALRASRQVGPHGTVIAVEPEPANAACLRANIRLNDIPNVIVVERALDAISDKTVNVIGTGTTAHVEQDGTVIRPWDPTAGTARIAIRTISLDEVLEELSLDRLDSIKMDVEGAENSIFAATSTSAALGTASAVGVEVHDGEGAGLVQNRLRSEGYSYVGKVKPESEFLISSIRRGLLRPDIVLKLYGMEVATVVDRMVSGALRRQPLPATHLLGMVYASR